MSAPAASAGASASVAAARRSAAAFTSRAATAVADTHLREALANATDRLALGRANQLAALPDAPALRGEARAIRLRTLAALDRYVDQFEAAATRAGATVHRAATAADATRIVAELARAAGAGLVTKSKSMVSEEVELNQALEAAGMRVVETDLGEFIVQLAGDHPSHIIVPVVHRTRHEVADLFRRTLGAKDEEVVDIASMTALARRVLRREFLEADVGISGANFLVAETGTVCVVTNEGNGRMCTSVPRTHIVLAGIERVVPTLGDLGVLLQLLARSATGQALTSYTSLLTGPRRRHPEGAEPDGPDQMHIVLVDNGRRQILASDVSEILACIRCGACLNHCPVYRAIGGHAYGSVYPGPIGSVFTPAQRGVSHASALPHASSLCGACREVCPVGIEIPTLLLRLRARVESRRAAPGWLRAGVAAFGATASRPALYSLAGSALRWWGRLFARKGWIGWLPGPLGGWTATRDFPAPAPRPFSQLWRDRRRPQ